MDDISKLLALTDTALREFDRLWNGVSVPMIASQGEVFHVLTSLATAARANLVKLLRSYYADDQPGTASACRNLLELSIFTKFVLKSRVHLLEFAADRLIDGVQLAKGLKTIEEQLDPETISSTVDAVIKAFEAQLMSENIQRTKYLKMDEVAEAVGMKSQYLILNQVCSKFVHPTSWSLLTADHHWSDFLLPAIYLWDKEACFFLAYTPKCEFTLELMGLHLSMNRPLCAAAGVCDRKKATTTFHAYLSAAFDHRQSLPRSPTPSASPA